MTTDDPFHPRPPLTWDGGTAFAPFIAAMRCVQDLANGSNPPQEVLEDATARLVELADLLSPHRSNEAELIAGRRDDLPGRGHSLLLPFEADEQSDVFVRGRVSFTQFYLGGNGAAHGGTLPLLFDEVLGHLNNSGGRAVARTAYLHVNYRHITPMDTELVLEATYEREEGRKRWVTGRLLDGDTVVADAEGMFIVLLPGQP